jgi:hypothetical protein
MVRSSSKVTSAAPIWSHLDRSWVSPTTVPVDSATPLTIELVSPRMMPEAAAQATSATMLRDRSARLIAALP